MKTRFTLPFLFILSAVLLQSCSAPKNIIKLQPEAENIGRWLYGQHYVADSLNGVIYEVGFERCENEQYWFDFTVTNCSNLPVLINPSEFKLQAFDGKHELLSNENITALDPEAEILSLDKSLAKANAREANHVGLSLLAAGIDVATGIATATDENPHNDGLRTYFFEGVQVGREVNASVSQDIKTLKNEWENSTIRKTTLDPNYNIQGKVFFPAVRSAIYIKLLLPVDSEYVEINFAQLQIPVN
ncbi:MAG: hypothetical protein R2757_17675 [Draconibacterium sp.]